MSDTRKGIDDLIFELRAVGIDVTPEELEDIEFCDEAMYESWFIEEYGYSWVFDETKPRFG